MFIYEILDSVISTRFLCKEIKPFNYLDYTQSGPSKSERRSDRKKKLSTQSAQEICMHDLKSACMCVFSYVTANMWCIRRLYLKFKIHSFVHVFIIEFSMAHRSATNIVVCSCLDSKKSYHSREKNVMLRVIFSSISGIYFFKSKIIFKIVTFLRHIFNAKLPRNLAKTNLIAAISRNSTALLASM